MMLNQTFTNKIGLCKNANIYKNIYYENIKIKGGTKIENLSILPINERNIFSDANF